MVWNPANKSLIPNSDKLSYIRFPFLTLIPVRRVLFPDTISSRDKFHSWARYAVCWVPFPSTINARRVPFLNKMRSPPVDIFCQTSPLAFIGSHRNASEFSLRSDPNHASSRLGVRCSKALGRCRGRIHIAVTDAQRWVSDDAASWVILSKSICELYGHDQNTGINWLPLKLKYKGRVVMKKSLTVNLHNRNKYTFFSNVFNLVGIYITTDVSKHSTQMYSINYISTEMECRAINDNGLLAFPNTCFFGSIYNIWFIVH